LQFDSVDFAYNCDDLVLKGFTTEVDKGETSAVVGLSGSGKSTLFKLLLGFYKSAAGRICLFGRDIREYSLSELRGLIAYVPQESYLFSGTIRENISYGRLGASEEEIIDASKAAFAHDFIMELPEGYETQVGERGARLSGGQRQRIAIARALLKNAPVLLLDEATASLDSESEQQVQQALEVLMKGRTSIAVAHRLSTIRNAKNILVMDSGSVVEEGNHDFLLSLDGAYARLYHIQRDGSLG
jgi:ABC-type multidrug transport system fused ATPase/permease subunit